MGRGLYAEHVMRTEIVDYAIFSVDEPVTLEVSTEPIVIGTLTAEEDHTLDILLKTSAQKTSECNTTQTSSVIIRTEGLEHPDLREFDKIEKCVEGAHSSEDLIELVNLDSSNNNGPKESAINEHNITRPSDENTV